MHSDGSIEDVVWYVFDGMNECVDWTRQNEERLNDVINGVPCHCIIDQVFLSLERV